jgi:CRP-like cAMP-binding protein
MADSVRGSEGAEVVRRVLSRPAPLTDTEWSVLRPLLRRKALTARQPLLRAGEVCRDLAFVECGLLRYFLVGDGREFTGNFFFEESVAADYGSFVSQTAATQWVDAVEDSVVWLLGYTELQRLYASSAAWERRGRLIAEAVLAAAQRRTAALVLQDAEARYRAIVTERPKILERVPKHMIAAYLGITPEALSRLRRKLARGT